MKNQIVSNATIRAAAILTTSYVASTDVNAGNGNQAVVGINFTKGSLTSAQIKFQYSRDNGATWLDYTISDTANGTTSSNEFIAPLRVWVHQLDTTCDVEIPVPLKANRFRVLVKGTGTVTSSSMTITCLVGVA